jgi:hypothetical protein
MPRDRYSTDVDPVRAAVLSDPAGLPECGFLEVMRNDGMADRHPIENREAAVGAQVFHMRQRWEAAVWRAQTQVLLGRLKCALPGWEEAESRRAADTATEASWRSHASGSGDGGGLGGDSSWGAGYGGDVGRVDRQ